MMIEGPASVDCPRSPKPLEQGRVGHKVPTQAIGFTVATPAADFVDLGTEFTLTLEKAGSCELQVFDGLVELDVRKRQHTESSSGCEFRKARPSDSTQPNATSPAFPTTKSNESLP